MEALTEPLLADKDECESSLGDLSEGFFSAVENDQEQGESSTIARRPQDENDYAVTPSWSLLLYRIFHTPLLPEYGGDHNLKTQIRFIKFLLVTILGIATTHWTVLWMVRVVLPLERHNEQNQKRILCMKRLTHFFST